MQIWSAEIKELEVLYASIKGRFPLLEKDLGHLLKTDDENVALLYSRRCLEIIVTDLCECELKRTRGTEPLKGIIDKLSHEKKVPSNIIASMEGLNTLSTFGTHPKDFDPQQVRPILLNLATIIKWYVKYKDTQIISQAKPEEIKYESKEQVDTREGINKPKKKLILMLSGLLLVMAIVIVALFMLNIIGEGKQTKEIEKSIAVLPFVNDSPEEENAYFINGIMDEVLINLQTIKELRVISRTSVEKYRGSDKPSVREIAKELGVNYIVEGSGQKYGNTFRLRVQLLDLTDKERQIWGEFYEREIQETKDVFRIQSQIAQSIASELEATITPEEKQLIEKVPTSNVTALDFYQRGREEEGKYSYYDLTESSVFSQGLNPSSLESIKRAERMYKEAVKCDSTYAMAYTGLAGIYWRKNYYKEYFSENFLDSVLFLANKALSFDDHLPDAYYIRAMYYAEKGINKQTLENFDKTLNLNPNYWLAYYGKGFISDDYVVALENLKKAASRNHGSGLSDIFEEISFRLSNSGFSELAKNYSLETVKLESDSSKYYFWLWMYEFDYNKCFEFYEKRYSIDSTDLTASNFLANYYGYNGRFKESLRFYKKWLNGLKTEGRTNINEMQRIGYAYSKNGFRDSADYYFNKQIEYCNNGIRSGRPYGISAAYYDLAGVYAYTGNKIKAYENLKIFNQGPMVFLWLVRFIKKDPLFDSIRDEPEFQQIVSDMEAKYQAEHERVRKWLEEQGEI
jgi:TolB-like protein